MREVFEYRRPKLKLVRYWQMSYKCPACHKKGRSVIVRASVPKTVAESQSGRSFGGSRNHVPEVCECHAAVPAGSSLETAGGNIQPDHHGALDHPVCGRLAWSHLWDAMRKELLQREVLHADETVVQVLKENGKTAQSKSYMWVYRTGMDGLPPIVLYDYQPGRSGEYPRSFWRGSYGYLHTDGYAGYNQVPDITRCGCWAICAGSSWRPCCCIQQPQRSAHNRHRLAGITVTSCLQLKRNWLDCQPKERQNSALRWRNPCSGLFGAGWKSWNRQPLAGNLKKAVQYARKQQPYMENYLLDPRCQISNNLAENAIRPLYCGTQELAVQ